MNYDDFHKEIDYRTSRSGGAGGQNVNKVSTKVELLFDVNASLVLSERRKLIVLEKLSNRITSEGILTLKCDETRSQLSNKKIVFERFVNLIKTALTPIKKGDRLNQQDLRLEKDWIIRRNILKKLNRKFKEE